MKIQFKKLLTGFLVISLTAGIFAVPAGAAVRSETEKSPAVKTEKTAEPYVGNELLFKSRTESHTPIDLSGATWKKVGNHLRLQSSNGKYKTGFVKHNNKLYYFNSKGNLVTGFFTAKGKKYYASYVKGEKGKGEILTGLVKIGNYYYYLNPSSTPYKGVIATGFRTISGRRYYFNSAGHMSMGWFSFGNDTYYASCNKKKHLGALLTGVQKIGSKYYKLDANGKLLGQTKTQTNSNAASSKYTHMIDISEHQGVIDFAKVKAAGVKAVMIRAGYGKSTVDKYFHRNITQAKAAGLKVGIYWFSYAATNKQAVREANLCLRIIKAYKIDLPVYFDWEYASMDYTRVKSRKKITDMTAAFCSKIKSSGHRAGYYFNLQYYNNYYQPSRLTKYSTWYAYWGTNKPHSAVWTHADTMATPTKFDIWQFTSKGRISGIKGYVDCDLLLNPSIKK